jgi:uncharacterized protein YdaU (DUF1376 family)
MARDQPDSFMPLNIGLYLSDTTHLSAAEHGAYLLLLMAYWRNGGPLPDDDSELQAIAKLSQEQWSASRKRIRKFFFPIIVDGEPCLGQKRAELELAEARKRFADKSKAGKAGNSKRWGERVRSDITEPSQSVSQPASQIDRSAIAEPIANGSPYTSTTNLKDKPSLRSGVPPAAESAELPIGVSQAKPDEIQQAVEIYNAIAKPLGWPECKKTNDFRKSKLRTRLKDFGGIPGWRDAMTRASKSPFLRGEQRRSGSHENWRPDLDFFLQEQSFIHLIEGKFDPAGSAQSATHNTAANGHTMPALTDLPAWRKHFAKFAENAEAGIPFDFCWPPKWGPPDASKIPPELRGEFQRLQARN